MSKETFWTYFFLEKEQMNVFWDIAHETLGVLEDKVGWAFQLCFLRVQRNNNDLINLSWHQLRAPHQLSKKLGKKIISKQRTISKNYLKKKKTYVKLVEKNRVYTISMVVHKKL